MNERPEPHDDDESPPQLPMRVHPEPALIWQCPGPGCGAQSAAPGMPLIRALMDGKRLRMDCRRCGQRVELTAPERQRIIVPGQSEAPANRQQRRAQVAHLRRKKGDGA